MRDARRTFIEDRIDPREWDEFLQTRTKSSAKLAPAPPPFVLDVVNVHAPPAWRVGQAVVVDFSLQNNSPQLTSGVVNASAWQGQSWQYIVKSHWFGIDVVDIQAGQAFNDSVRMKNWSANPAASGGATITLNYWVLDVGGTISVPVGVSKWADAGGVSKPVYTYETFALAVSADQGVANVCTTSYALDIKPMFRQYDIDAMKEFLYDLGSDEGVKQSAKSVYKAVSESGLESHRDESCKFIKIMVGQGRC